MCTCTHTHIIYNKTVNTKVYIEFLQKLCNAGATISTERHQGINIILILIVIKVLQFLGRQCFNLQHEKYIIY